MPTMEVSKCPFCKKKVTDIIKHFSISHDIRNMDQLKEELEKLEQVQRKRVDFSNYVEELKQKEREGHISAEDYRRLLMEWDKQHKC